LNRRPLSEPKAASAFTRFVPLGIGIILLLIGCGLFWSMLLPPLRQLLQSRNWVATNCKILQSSVELVQKKGKAEDYRPRISYEYTANGNRQTSSRFSFGSSIGKRSWAEKISDQYKTGTNQTCYFDPANPSEAVLRRDLHELGTPCFACGMPLFLGYFLLSACLRPVKPKKQLSPHSLGNPTGAELRREASQQSPATNQGVTSPRPESDEIFDSQTKRATPSPYSERANWQSFVGPQKFKPTATRVEEVFYQGVFALIWNIVIGLFYYDPIKRLDWLTILFMSPLVFLGIFFICLAFYKFLKLFNPIVELALSEGAVPLGDSFDVAWELKGRVSRIKELVISVVGEEQATYTRGTDTITDKKVFHTIELTRTSAATEMQFGTATVAIPPNTMHSHSGEKNKVVWKIIVQGEVPVFPNVQGESEFLVIPKGVA